MTRAIKAQGRIRRKIVFDLETTGLDAGRNRIITLGAVRLDRYGLIQGKALHLIFDPRQDSHPAAFQIHGWDNWTTRFQPLFADLAPFVRDWFSWAEELVAHNAAFDYPFLQRALRKANLPVLDLPVQCTMLMARERWPGERAKLDDCLTRVGLQRSSRRHGALEDALLTAHLLSHLEGRPLSPPASLDRLPGPTNYVTPDPVPKGDLPRRTPKRHDPDFLKKKGLNFP
ncbi:MAG: exonuclease domain-containing protein [Rhizobiaceae bacterium]